MKPSYQILHQDPAIIAINKPPGLSVLPGRGQKQNLLDLLTHDPRLNGLKPLTIHRLDADTSGLILLAAPAAYWLLKLI